MTDRDKLNQEELRRYARHLALPGFGMEGQQKLKMAKVLVLGAGGLGAPVLLYLAAAGVGHIGIVDFDRVEDTNLQRQVLYTIEDVGQFKAEAARRRLLALNPHIKVEAFTIPFQRENALELIAPFDIVVDGTDNFPTRYLSNDACVLAGKPLIYGSIFRFEGQVSVFNYLLENGERGPNYRDLFPTPPPPELVPNCAEGGVLGVLPGIIGSMQANEAIKVLTGIGQPLAGKLLLFDAASFSSRILNIPKNPGLEIKELIDYEQFCAPSPPEPVQEVSVEELQELLVEKADIQLIDVREPFEYGIANLGGALIPPSEILETAGRISHDKKVILYCRTGKRSAEAIRQLKQHYGLENLYNLKGGILAWAQEIDPSMKQY
ncbi:MAG: molybdopterin-synthase adenylyltransferase MoeB [Phaeodactylibacter sp.]|nr:molybdopterin-synthase adenylyltransferase MoeB [Phaeodactylibacter sp.]MCB9301064.1 molybdopterin-synthase adenylyltransferase MoeB [Lewinellaceae bacterium]